MSKRIIPYFTLLLLVFTSTLVAWFPFLLKGEMSTIYKHFDGPLYIIAAKTGYNPAAINLLDRDAVLPHNPLYFAAHLPGYPFFIWLGSFAFGFLKSMLSVTIISTILLAWLFYYIVRRFQLSKQPLLLTSVFLFLPRFLVVRSVGSPEPLFILFILGSLFFFEKKNYLFAGILGGLATMTKTPGILLFPAYILAIGEGFVIPAKAGIQSKIFNFKLLYLLLIPFGLLMVFGIYAVQYKDFFAYFHSGDNVHLLYPYSVFTSSAAWVGTAWLEDVIFYFALYASTVVSLWNSKYRSFFYFALVFFSATIFVQHRDISRYSLPLWPLAVIAFEHVLTSKKALLVFCILLLGIYMYAWNFLGTNTMPITEWLPFL
ncbi:MAG: hypothetical protein WA061_05055 [Microgenomates group bacterium]